MYVYVLFNYICYLFFDFTKKNKNDFNGFLLSKIFLLAKSK